MISFEQELMRRSPLAACVLETCDFIFDDAFLRSIWDKHRGRCYEDVLKFEDFLRLMRDALVNHDGSAHQVFVELARPSHVRTFFAIFAAAFSTGASPARFLPRWLAR